MVEARGTRHRTLQYGSLFPLSTSFDNGRQKATTGRREFGLFHELESTAANRDTQIARSRPLMTLNLGLHNRATPSVSFTLLQAGAAALQEVFTPKAV